MAFTIADATLAVKEPNTGWPDLRPLQHFQWQIDVTESSNQDNPTYESIEIYQVSDNLDVTANFSISGSGNSDGKLITAQKGIAPASSKSIEHYAVIWWLDGANRECDIIYFRVLNG